MNKQGEDKGPERKRLTICLKKSYQSLSIRLTSLIRIIALEDTSFNFLLPYLFMIICSSLCFYLFLTLNHILSGSYIS